MTDAIRTTQMVIPKERESVRDAFGGLFESNPWCKVEKQKTLAEVGVILYYISCVFLTALPQPRLRECQ